MNLHAQVKKLKNGTLKEDALKALINGGLLKHCQRHVDLNLSLYWCRDRDLVWCGFTSRCAVSRPVLFQTCSPAWYSSMTHPC